MTKLYTGENLFSEYVFESIGEIRLTEKLC